MTFDLWIACIAWGLDLKAIKTLCYNSIMQSSLPDDEKQSLRAGWSDAWQQWAQSIGEPA